MQGSWLLLEHAMHLMLVPLIINFDCRKVLGIDMCALNSWQWTKKNMNKFWCEFPPISYNHGQSVVYIHWLIIWLKLLLKRFSFIHPDFEHLTTVMRSIYSWFTWLIIADSLDGGWFSWRLFQFSIWLLKYFSTIFCWYHILSVIAIAVMYDSVMLSPTPIFVSSPFDQAWTCHHAHAHV